MDPVSRELRSLGAQQQPVQTPQLVAGQVVQAPAATAAVVVDSTQAVVVAQ